MAKVFAFTMARVEAANCPPGKSRIYYRDERSTNLWLTVTSKGARSFNVYKKINGKPTRVLIGPFPEVSVDEARRQADKLVGEIRTGTDPRASRREMRNGVTLGELFGQFIEDWAKTRKKTWADDEAQFERYLTKWKSWTIGEIQQHHIATLHSKIGKEHGHYAANRLLALLHSLFVWAGKKRGFKGGNPASGVDRFPERKRERFLQPAELPKFFKAVEAEPNETIRDFVLISLYVGARRANVQAMAWEDLDLVNKVWTIPDTKSGKAVLVPLCSQALDILHRRQASQKSNPSAYVFPGWGKSGHLEEPKSAWAAILKRAGIDDLRLHDLRRTFGSFQAIGGSSLPIIGQSLGHSSTAATSIYARLHMDAVRSSIDAAVNAMHAAAGKQEGGAA